LVTFPFVASKIGSGKKGTINKPKNKNGRGGLAGKGLGTNRKKNGKSTRWNKGG